MPNPRQNGKKIPTVILCVAVLAVGLGAGYAIGYVRTMNSVTAKILTIKPIREHNQNYPLIFPLLIYDFGDAKPFFEDKSLEAKVSDFIRTQYASGNAQSVSVSVREFSLNRWAGVNQNVQYQPGSMLKVLIMMAYFREAQRGDPAILAKPLTYTAATDQETNSLPFRLPTQLKVGASYAVEDLLHAMIADSDNGAETLLIDNVDRPTLNQVYVDLGIPSPDIASSTYAISPDQYMDFLRILYNATYLSDAYSEEALAIMSQSTYRDGISAGVPADITVAQKYGERVDTSADGAIQAVELHNCGVVYPDNHPYALCIMTKGADVNKLTTILKDISALVYQYVTSQ